MSTVRYFLTFYVDFLPNGFAGMANGPIIRLLKSHRSDEGLYRHELVHVKQWFLTIGLHSAIYLLSAKYRLWAEVEAYKEQLKYYKEDRSSLFADFIITNYNLKLSHSEAISLLKKK